MLPVFKRLTVPALLLGILAFVNVLLTIKAIEQRRDVRMFRQFKERPAPLHTPEIVGYTASGDRASPSNPPRRFLVVSVLTSGRERDEFATRAAVARSLPTSSFEFVTYCASPDCPIPDSQSSATVLTEVPIVVARTLWRYAGAQKLVVLDRRSSSVTELRWTTSTEMVDTLSRLLAAD